MSISDRGRSTWSWIHTVTRKNFIFSVS